MLVAIVQCLVSIQCAADNQTPFSIQKSQICLVIMLQCFEWLVPILLTQATAVVLSIIILTWRHVLGNSDCSPNKPALSSSALMLMPVSVTSQWPPVCPRSHEAPQPDKDASEKTMKSGSPCLLRASVPLLAELMFSFHQEISASHFRQLNVCIKISFTHF